LALGLKWYTKAKAFDLAPTRALQTFAQGTMSELMKRVGEMCPSTPMNYESLRAPFDSRALRASRMVEAASADSTSQNFLGRVQKTRIPSENC